VFEILREKTRKIMFYSRPPRGLGELKKVLCGA
jgi:hypothetical protein